VTRAAVFDLFDTLVDDDSGLAGGARLAGPRTTAIPEVAQHL
jgi:hypothetical protein